MIGFGFRMIFRIIKSFVFIFTLDSICLIMKSGWMWKNFGCGYCSCQTMVISYCVKWGTTLIGTSRENRHFKNGVLFCRICCPARIKNYLAPFVDSGLISNYNSLRLLYFIIQADRIYSSFSKTSSRGRRSKPLLIISKPGKFILTACTS